MEMASSSNGKIETLPCKNIQTENSKIKNKTVKLPNIFEELLESLLEELPSKENLQSTISLG
ncbi:hypothetical protein Avbf_11428 [Armadillidium vulgare]|nr:hypothetical protein Avbf_11428 [Armadillidium vulgare]